MDNLISNSEQTHDLKYFWYLQAMFWLGLCVLTLITETVWYSQFGLSHVAHTVLQAILGLLLSLLLQLVFASIWNASLKTRVLVSLVSVLMVAALWNISRMILFIWLTGDDQVLADFGAWYFGSVYLFLCWTALYHGIRYFQLLRSENVMKLTAEATVSDEQFKRLVAESKAKDAKLENAALSAKSAFLI